MKTFTTSVIIFYLFYVLNGFLATRHAQNASLACTGSAVAEAGARDATGGNCKRPATIIAHQAQGLPAR
ncbi:MAG: hypothetical protein V4724_04205 [Pseudomonadota bacterium]